MSNAWKILHLELSQPLAELPATPDYTGILVIFWWRQIPIGQLEIPAAQLPIPVTQLLNLAAQAVTPAVGCALLEYGFRAKLPVVSSNPARDRPPDFQALMALPQPLHQLQAQLASSEDRTVSVIICTRDRPEQLATCLRSLQALNQPPHEILVVDNAPSTDATQQLVAQIPNVRYVREPRPGLSVARNTGIRHSTGDLIAFTDDDVQVHPDWTTHLQRAFQTETVMAMTGLILPAELETEAQLLFQNGGTGWPYRPLTFDSQFFADMKRRGVPVWRIGAGANMAFRRQICDRVGLFDQRLGAGASGCSEDSEFWYRILAAGWLCRYEPTAVVFHYHRRDMAGLQHQMYQYMRGHVTALLVQFARYQHWGNLRRLGIALPRYYTGLLFRGLLNGFKHRYRTLPAEISGCFAGIAFYLHHHSSSSHGGVTNRLMSSVEPPVVSLDQQDGFKVMKGNCGCKIQCLGGSPPTPPIQGTVASPEPPPKGDNDGMQRL